MKVFIRRSLTAGILFFVALLSLPSAQAHSDLISSNPVAGANLEQFPESFYLTFNEELILIEGETVNTLILQGSDSTSYEILDPRVVGAVLSAKAGSAEYPAGTFLLKYRVVSADGHPITGEITFSTQSSTTIQSQVAQPATTQEIEPESSSSGVRFFIAAAIFLILAISFGVRFVKRDSQ